MRLLFWIVLCLFLLAALLPAQDSSSAVSPAADPSEPAAPDKDKDKNKQRDGKKGKKKSTDDAKHAVGEEDEEVTAAGPSGYRFVMGKHPGFNLGEWGHIEFRGKVQVDFRGYDPDLSTVDGCGVYAASDGCLFDLRKVRVGVKGTIAKYFDFEVERELKDIGCGGPLPGLGHAQQTSDSGCSSAFFRQVGKGPDDFAEEQRFNLWRDVYVDFKYFKRFQIQVGKFKVPFGQEEISGDTDRDFIYNSRIGDLLSPGRDQGIMLHGRLWNKELNYSFGLFKHDGDNTRLTGTFATNFAQTATGERTFAGRVSGAPLRHLRPLPKLLKKIEFGAAFTESPVPQGLKSLRGRTTSKLTFFEHHFVRGQRWRLGSDFSWKSGPFGVKGEFVRVSEERLQQGLRGDDLPNLLTHSWYLSGSWLLTGERKDKLVIHHPFRPWIVWGGPGAVEIAVRYEQLRFSSDTNEGRPSRGLRAANVLQTSDRTWTFGANWYVNRWVKIQASFARDRVEDIQRLGQDLFNQLRSPSGKVLNLWNRAIRIQYVF